jgi:hypothetical protein
MGKGTQRLHRFVEDTPVRMVTGKGQPVELAALDRRLTGNRMVARTEDPRGQKRGQRR